MNINRTDKQMEIPAAAVEGKAPAFSRETARMLRMITEHSGRAVVYYDVESGLVRVCKPQYPLSDWISGRSLLSYESLTRESRTRVEQMMQAIRLGSSGGEVKL